MTKPEVVAEYVRAVPKDFRFSIKVPNAITLKHQHSKGKLKPNPHFLSNDLMEDFLKILEPMPKQINSLIFQFEYLNKQKMPNQMMFQDRLHGPDRKGIEQQTKSQWNAIVHPRDGELHNLKRFF